MIQGRALIVNDFRLKKTGKIQKIRGFAGRLCNAGSILPDRRCTLFRPVNSLPPTSADYQSIRLPGTSVDTCCSRSLSAV